MRERADRYFLAVVVVVAVAIGVAAIVFGEADDSPGLQLVGAVLVLGALAYGVRAVVRSG